MDCLVQLGGQGLFQPADAQIGTAHHFAAVRFNFTHDDPENRRFPGPIAANQTDPFAVVNVEAGGLQQTLIADFQGNVIKTEQSNDNLMSMLKKERETNG